MEVQTISNVVGYFYNSIVKEFRTTYDYEKGNDVTIVERRSQTIQLYSASGQLEGYPNTGNQVDIKA